VLKRYFGPKPVKIERVYLRLNRQRLKMQAMLLRVGIPMIQKA